MGREGGAGKGEGQCRLPVNVLELINEAPREAMELQREQNRRACLSCMSVRMQAHSLAILR